jgi:hypothetical protein
MRGKEKIEKMVFIILLSFVILILFSNISSAEKIKWKDVQNIDNSLVYNLGMAGSYGSEYLDYNEFILNDEIHTVYLKFLHIPQNINKINFNLKILSMNGTALYQCSLSTDSAPSSFLRTADLKLNQSGLGFWVLFFEIERDNNSNLDEIALIEFHGNSESLEEDSIVQVLENKPWGKLDIYNNVEYKRAFTVYTQSEAAQIISARALEKAAEYQQDAAASSKDLIFWQQIAVAAMFCTAFATAILAIFTRSSAKKTSLMAESAEKNVLEIKKERNRDNIKDMIFQFIDKAIPEFKTINEKVQLINQDRIYESSLVLLNDDMLRSPYGLDFAKIYPQIFKKIVEYLDYKYDYNDIYRELHNEIEDSARNLIRNTSGIKISIGKKIKKENYPGNIEAYFNEYIAEDLSSSILCNEKLGDNRCQYFFNKYNNDWISIKNERSIHEKITWLKLLTNKMDEYNNLANILKDKRDQLMNDYDITPSQIEIMKGY